MSLTPWILVTLCGGAVALAACASDTFEEFPNTGGGGATSSGGATGGGGTGGTSSGTSSGTGGTSSGTGGGTGGAGEDCTNALDDDGDGLVDCEDESCTGGGYQCLEVPADWQGPVYLKTSDGACPDEWPTAQAQGAESYGGDDATCGCDCGAPDASCTGDAYLHLYSGAACQSGNTWMGTIPQGCSSLPNGATMSARVVSNLSFGGSCPNAQGTVQNLPAVSPSGEARACGEPPMGAGCGAGACTPEPPANSALCVYADGDLGCPPGFTEKTVIYTGYDDTRDCICTCGATGTCAGSVSLYVGPNNNCQSSGGSLAADSVCVTFNGSIGVVDWSNLTATPNGNCSQNQGGGAIGGVVPTDPVTICCQ